VDFYHNRSHLIGVASNKFDPSELRMMMADLKSHGRRKGCSASRSAMVGPVKEVIKTLAYAVGKGLGAFASAVVKKMMRHAAWR
jgi:hypothetical protein